MLDLPARAEWLDERLEKLGLSRNEFGRQIGVSQSSVSNFVHGIAGADVCVKIANALNVSPQLTLAMIGLTPPPASYANEQLEEVVLSCRGLDHDNCQLVIDFAKLLLSRQSQR